MKLYTPSNNITPLTPLKKAYEFGISTTAKIYITAWQE